jgi:hypothetical protein
MGEQMCEESDADLAYPLAVNSYQDTAREVNTMDARLQTLLAWATTVSLAFIAAVAGRGYKLSSGWFITAAITFMIGAGCSIFALFRGQLWGLDPGVINARYLGLSSQEFKRKFVEEAGSSYEKNTHLLIWKRRLAMAAATIFLVELACLALWAVASA